MNDILFVRSFQRIRDLASDRQGFLEGNGACLQAIRQRGAFHKLQHQGIAFAGVLDAVYRSDIRMVERGQQASFPLKAASSAGVLNKRKWQYFESDVPSQL